VERAVKRFDPKAVAALDIELAAVRKEVDDGANKLTKLLEDLDKLGSTIEVTKENAEWKVRQLLPMTVSAFNREYSAELTGLKNDDLNKLLVKIPNHIDWMMED
jgi:hypothetical protein